MALTARRAWSNVDARQCSTTMEVQILAKEERKVRNWD
jgi:hypothetical protein